MNIILDGNTLAKINENNYRVTNDNKNNSIIPINSSDGLAEAIKELNNDSIEPHSKTSAIDLKTRLSAIEIGYILQMDACVQLSVLPMSCLKFTRQKKRLVVSLNGMGRSEIRDILAPRTDDKTKDNVKFFSRLLGKTNE